MGEASLAEPWWAANRAASRSSVSRLTGSTIGFWLRHRAWLSRSAARLAAAVARSRWAGLPRPGSDEAAIG